MSVKRLVAVGIAVTTVCAVVVVVFGFSALTFFVLLAASAGYVALAISIVRRTGGGRRRRRYNLSATKPDRTWGHLTAEELAVELHRLGVPAYEADAEYGDTTTSGGSRVIWRPSTMNEEHA